MAMNCLNMGHKEHKNMKNWNGKWLSIHEFGKKIEANVKGRLYERGNGFHDKLNLASRDLAYGFSILDLNL